MCNDDTGNQQAVLCIDIGSRTQDALIFTPGEDLRSASRLVLPAPVLTLARRIRQLTNARRDIFIQGTTTGGEILAVLLAHAEAGCGVAIHPRVAAGIHAAPSHMASKGITLTKDCPDGYVQLDSFDVDIAFWHNFCQLAGFAMPPLIAVAAQDHSRPPNGNSTSSRMTMWRELLHSDDGQAGFTPQQLVFHSVPPKFSRLAAIQAVTGGPVADSSIAAILGLLSMPEIASRSHRQGIVLVNAGNSHISAFLVYKERIFGVYEQHTFGISVDQIVNDLAEFRLGWLPDEKVRAEGGHGCALLELSPEAEGFSPAYIAGPQRQILTGYGQLTAPYGDGLMTGCFGLLHGLDRI